MTILDKIKVQKEIIAKAKQEIALLEMDDKITVTVNEEYQKALTAVGVSSYYAEAKIRNSEVIDRRMAVFNLMVRELNIDKRRAIEAIGLHRTLSYHYIQKHDALHGSYLEYTELYNNALKNL